MKMLLLAITSAAILATNSGNVNAQDTTTDKGKTSYALGYRAGLDIANVLKSGEQIDMATVLKALQDAASGKEPAVPPEQLGSAFDNLQKRMAARTRARLEKRAADNKVKGDAFLAQNRNKSGVKVLPSGVQYRVIEVGTGPRPTQANQITVVFRHTLPDGTLIADTDKASYGQPAGPVTVRLSEIPFSGLREALLLMPAGSRWEVMMPGAAAHGTSIDRAGEMANQVIIFNIKLSSVGPVTAAPKSGG